MAATVASLRKTGRYRVSGKTGPTTTKPKTLKELLGILDPMSRLPPPFRPMGANSSSTDCNSSSVGTIVDMTGMNNVLNVDAYNDTVVVQAGVRLSVLSEQLAEHGLELAGNYDLADRTVGGAIAGGCLGPAIADEGTLFSAQVLSMRVVTAGGKISNIESSNKNLLRAFRVSYGMLGIIFEATLKVRPIRGFVATHRRCTVKQFAAASESLAQANVGIKFFLMPFRDRVYLDLRRHSPDARATRKIPWKLKDWGESTVLPQIFNSINRIVPVSGMRYRIIDEISKATQGIVNNRLVRSGDNSTALGGKGRGEKTPLQYSTWLFPAADFSIVVQTYCEFCRDIQRQSGFRCDMPTVGYRLSHDASALLSPSFDEQMFALRAVSTQTEGWEDFAIDFAEFAEHWGGYPMFNQTRGLSPAHAHSALAQRATAFRKIRRQLDPDDRMMNPFLSQYFL